MSPQLSRDKKIPGLEFPKNPAIKRLKRSRDFGIPTQILICPASLMLCCLVSPFILHRYNCWCIPFLLILSQSYNWFILGLRKLIQTLQQVLVKYQLFSKVKSPFWIWKYQMMKMIMLMMFLNQKKRTKPHQKFQYQWNQKLILLKIWQIWLPNLGVTVCAPHVEK